MAEFYVSQTQDELATQVASLLNRHNRLTKVHNNFTINGKAVKYYIEFAQYLFDSSVKSMVAGCVGLSIESPQLTKLHHLCVDEQYRNKGLAKNLIRSALKACQTPSIYMKVREDNKSCLRVAFGFGFNPTVVEARAGYNLITLFRRV